MVFVKAIRNQESNGTTMYGTTRCSATLLECQTKPAKKILIDPLENWRSPSVRHHTTWMKATQQDLKSHNRCLNEAIDVAQNHPLWRMMSTFGAMHS